MGKTKEKYGIKPEVLGEIEVECEEMLAYLYLPIKMKGKAFNRHNLPKRLWWTLPLLQYTLERESDEGEARLQNMYMYLTAKKLYVTPDNPGNRPGWHGDGFGTDDINYIWMDKCPTLFCVQDFVGISNDHHKSMKQMEQQIQQKNVCDFGAKNLLRLTQHNIHRTPDIEEGCMRTFVKISFSEHKYNLKGNSHNYLIDYDWKMYDRSELRNDPAAAETDYVLKGNKPEDLEFMVGESQTKTN